MLLLSSWPQNHATLAAIPKTDGYVTLFLSLLDSVSVLAKLDRSYKFMFCMLHICYDLIRTAVQSRPQQQESWEGWWLAFWLHSANRRLQKVWVRQSTVFSTNVWFPNWSWLIKIAILSFYLSSVGWVFSSLKWQFPLHFTVAPSTLSRWLQPRPERKSCGGNWT